MATKIRTNPRLCACGVCECVCVCVFLYSLHTEYQNLHSTSKVRTFWGHEDILACPYNFKGLFAGWDMVLRLKLELGLGQGICCDGWVTVRTWEMHDVYQSPHKDRGKRMCVYCLWLMQDSSGHAPDEIDWLERRLQSPSSDHTLHLRPVPPSPPPSSHPWPSTIFPLHIL